MSNRQHQDMIETIINSVASLGDLETHPDLGSQNANRILANFEAAPDLEALFSLFQRHQMTPHSLLNTISNYTSESTRTQNLMLSRILDIPPYISGDIDDFF